MKTKIIIGASLLGAFLAGGLIAGYLKWERDNAPAADWAIAGPAASPGMPILFGCDDGMVAVTPIVQGGRSRIQINCVHDGILPAGAGHAIPRASFANETVRVEPVERVVERRVVRESPRVRRRRSWEREVLIVAGSAGAGTAIGAVAGGKKGAAIGAVAGGLAGLVYDLATRNR